MNARSSAIIARLANGETVLNREGGNSMTPIIESKQPVTIERCNPKLLEKGDIVYAKVNGRIYTHKVVGVAIDRVLIGNNHGHVNGWTSFDKVYGIITHINGNPVSGAKAKVI